MPKNVLVCDMPDEVARLQYHLLREAPDLVVEMTTDPFKAVESVGRTHPAVVVCELGMDGLGGSELVKRMRASSPGARIVCRSTSAGARRIAEALAAGASGYLLRDEGPQAVLTAIRAAMEGGVILSAGTAAMFGAEVADTSSRVGALESELAHLRTQVSQGTSAKSDFLANISHELRTPVTVAKGIAYVLRNPNVPDNEREQFLDQLQGSLDKLMALVDEVITIAELERGTFELDLSPTDLGPLVRHAVDEVSRQYPSVPISSQIQDQLVIVADGARLGGVIKELLDNACRYSPSGKSVELVARMLDEGIVVTVTDRGEGLDRAVAAQAFEQPFSTGEGTLRKEKAGVGVGLHLARQIILEHGGTMWSDPLPGGGTRISFCIPPTAGNPLEVPPAGAA
jgi:signal transduction histidine kinase